MCTRRRESSNGWCARLSQQSRGMKEDNSGAPPLCISLEPEQSVPLGPAVGEKSSHSILSVGGVVFLHV